MRGRFAATAALQFQHGAADTAATTAATRSVLEPGSFAPEGGRKMSIRSERAG